MRITRGFRFALYGLAVFILGASMYALAKPTTAGTIPAVSEIDHVRGNANAVVTLIEYSDFQCPACASFEPMLKELQNVYPNDLRVVYRHFPLYTLHPNAEIAALAAEAAGRQGKFWEMHDMLFDRQEDWADLAAPLEIFRAYADILGLESTQFSTDLGDSTVKDRVRIDVTSGNTARISATPTIYLNNEAIVFPKNESPFEYLKGKIDETLATKVHMNDVEPVTL